MDSHLEKLKQLSAAVFQKGRELSELRMLLRGLEDRAGAEGNKEAADLSRELHMKIEKAEKFLPVESEKDIPFSVAPKLEPLDSHYIQSIMSQNKKTNTVTRGKTTDNQPFSGVPYHAVHGIWYLRGPRGDELVSIDQVASIEDPEQAFNEI